MIELEKNAKLIITDSGGVQKEAFFFKKACIILRPQTEWVEIVDAETAIITDTDEDKIISSFNSFYTNPPTEFPAIFGDAKAAEFILKQIIKNGVTPIIAGFQGISEELRITTIGRGGSDTTAVAIASKLETSDVAIFAINEKGKAREGSFKAKQIDVLSIEFTILENEIAEVENVDIYINIIDPDQNTIFDVASGSGTFMFKGKEQFYTASKEILYDKSEQSLTFIYEKGSEYEIGEYYIEIYAKDFIIGGQSFSVK